MRRRLSRAALLLIAAALLTALFHLRVRHDMEDFAVNYQAGKRLSTGETLYRVEDEHWQFKYMPSSSLLYLPLSHLTPTMARAIWFLLVVGCCIGLVAASRRLLPAHAAASPWVVALPPLILLRFYLREIELGQINALVTLLLVLSVLLMSEETPPRRGRSRVLAGLLWGTAVALKPHAAIFLPYFVVKGRWRSLAAGLGVLAAAFFSPALYFGWKGNLIVHGEWLSTLSRSTPALVTSQDNISLIAMFSKWLGAGPLALAAAGAAIAALAGLVLFVIARGREAAGAAALEGALLLTLTPLVSPLGWDYTLLMATPGIMLLIDHFNQLPRSGRIILTAAFILTAVTLYDLLGREGYARFMSWSVLTINFLIIALYLSYLRMKKIC